MPDVAVPAERPAVLHYTEHGQGSPVVLVHGAGGSGATSWGSLPEHLASHHRVLLVDNPGSGGSALPEGPLQLDTLADSIALTAAQAGLERYAVVGYSMGSAIAVRHAVRHPAEVTALALLTGLARPDTRLRLALHNWQQLMDAEPALLGRYLLQLSCGPAALDQLDTADLDRLARETAAALPPGTRQHIDLALRIDVRAELRELSVPTLVIAAANDILVTPDHSAALAQGITGARLTQVMSGHDAPTEQPMAVSNHLRSLLNG
ncbi:alpha/beta fold hydrolase [Streptomyces nigrescens]|uniref:Alpha/beta fold hydrolase n=1 Tax=Streptomyces nigrescens TaxID=1920 RepID=A0A640TAU9_STRNI|nr:alpha/beta fold hydrolase [Streptomyces libani]WAT94516.1 alpha/beta fold hydrolase [Streptomyces libani subsp. libani]GFE19611.1 alpha/beta hydrolase [Streptomyces libani subsp. libani]GGW04529.1 alpha/beta hydrolase [Streptomyces libani subsp. libani]